jgi:primosomal replication protein N
MRDNNRTNVLFAHRGRRQQHVDTEINPKVKAEFEGSYTNKQTRKLIPELHLTAIEIELKSVNDGRR